MTRPLHCVICGAPLTGGLDTYGITGLELCRQHAHIEIDEADADYYQQHGRWFNDCPPPDNLFDWLSEYTPVCIVVPANLLSGVDEIWEEIKNAGGCTPPAKTSQSAPHCKEGRNYER
jgi:hypothetical protein